MNEQQLAIVGLVDRAPVTGERYLLEDDGPGQVVTLVEPVTPDDLLSEDLSTAYGSVRVRLDNGQERVVSTLGLGVLVVPVGE